MFFSSGKPSEATSQTSEQHDVSKYRPRNRRFASGGSGSGEGACPAGSAVGSERQGHSGGENSDTSAPGRGDEARERAPTSAVRMNQRPRRWLKRTPCRTAPINRKIRQPHRSPAGDATSATR